MPDIQFTAEEQVYLDSERPQAKEPPAVEKQEGKPPETAAETKPEDRQRDERGKFVPKEAAKTEPPAKEEAKPVHRPPWWDKVPPEAQSYIDNLHAARHQTRSESKELRKTLRSMEEFKTTAQQRLDQLLQAREQVPDPEMDPDGHRRFLESKLKATEEVETKRRQEEEERSAQQREFNDLNEIVTDQEYEYAEAHPDYWQAKQHAIEAGVKRLVEEYGVDEVTARQQANLFMVETAKGIRSIGGNVAHRFYHLAGTVYGFGKDTAKPGQEKPKEMPAVAETTDSLKALSSAQKAGKQPRGAASEVELTLEELVSMTDEEFHKIAGDNKKLRKLFGG